MGSRYQQDIEEILSHQNDQGFDLWMGDHKKLLKGSPFSTLDCISYLVELGMDKTDPLFQNVAEEIFAQQQADGRFKISPSGGIYPCQTALAWKALCSMGYANDERLKPTLAHVLATQQEDGGWKCNKYSFGRGPETCYSTPMTTLTILDAFRYYDHTQWEEALDKAVDFLLQHWVIKQPISPCHYGIGTLFMQVEYPFRGYNLFQYVYCLSFYPSARKDARFLEAFSCLKDKLIDGQIVVERIVPKLAKLSFCEKGKPSELATLRYQEIVHRLEE